MLCTHQRTGYEYSRVITCQGGVNDKGWLPGACERIFPYFALCCVCTAGCDSARCARGGRFLTLRYVFAWIRRQGMAARFMQLEVRIALYCSVQNCIALHYTVLHCTVLHCILLYCIALYCTVCMQTDSRLEEGEWRPRDQLAPGVVEQAGGHTRVEHWRADDVVVVDVSPTLRRPAGCSRVVVKSCNRVVV